METTEYKLKKKVSSLLRAGGQGQEYRYQHNLYK